MVNTVAKNTQQQQQQQQNVALFVQNSFMLK
jgi:hypothetical protein